MAIGNSTRTGPESDLREAIITGRLVDLSTGHPDADDPAHTVRQDLGPAARNGVEARVTHPRIGIGLLLG